MTNPSLFKIVALGKVGGGVGGVGVGGGGVGDGGVGGVEVAQEGL